jgi:uncharacterized protein YegP (UPF0339 family)
MVTGDHFVLARGENGRFVWELWGSNHPTGPIARSGRDYASAAAAKKSMKSARLAMVGAVEVTGDLRIDDRSRR